MKIAPQDVLEICVVEIVSTPKVVQAAVEAFDKIDKIYGDLNLHVNWTLESDICTFILKLETSMF